MRMTSDTMCLNSVFRPSSVAVVGASPTHAFARDMIDNFDRLGFDGQVWAVNPKYERVGSHLCFPDLDSLPETPDVVVVGVNRDLAPGVVEAAARVGAKGAVVFAIGFAEIGGDGVERQRRITAAATDARMALVGPNCQGVINFASRTPLYMAAVHPYRAGRVGLVSQSGSVTTALTNNKRGVRWSAIASVGNEAVNNCADVLGYFVDDDATDVVCIFMETIRDADNLAFQLDRAFDADKPVIVLKSGTSIAGAAAATAHSGALAMPDRLVRAMLARHGAIQVGSIEEMLATALAVQRRESIGGGSTLSLTASGGQIELLLDACEGTALEHTPIASEAAAHIRQILPDFLDVKNPLDWWGLDMAEFPSLMREVVRADGVDTVVAVSDFSNYPTGSDSESNLQLDSALSLAKSVGTDRQLVVLDSTYGSVPSEVAEQALEAGVLVLSGFQHGVKALDNVIKYRRFVKHRRPGGGASIPREIGGLAAGRSRAGAPALEFMQRAGFDVASQCVAADTDQAVAFFESLDKQRVVVKPGDPSLMHKAETGRIFLGLQDVDSVRRACDSIFADGLGPVLIQEYVDSGVEVLIGLKHDDLLGSFVMVGLGGIWTEIMDDVAIRPVGLAEGEALEMVMSLRAHRILFGARGSDHAYVDGLVSAIERLDALALSFTSEIQELDINPLMLTSTRAVVVDALIGWH